GLLAVADACGYAGFNFALVAEDDEGSGEGGAAVANKLVADPTFVAMAGPLFSGATAAAMPIYDAAGIAMLSPSATNPPLTAMGSAVFNRLPFTDAAQGAAAADYMFNKLGFTKVAFLHDGEDYGKGLAEAASAAFVALGGESVALQAITAGEADYTPILTTIAAESPDAIYYGGYNQEGAVIANQMKTVGLENATFFGCDGTYGADFAAQTGDNGVGSYHAIPRSPAETDKKANFDACYEEAYGIAPVTLSPFSYNSYDATQILIEAVKAVAVLGEDGNLYVPLDGVVAGVRGLTNYVGISGTYTCDAVGECNSEGPEIMVLEAGGEYVSAE
ncbi:MAG: branched-chain amino acid ABC transporter substrate-binding protein, partial [Anaerolineaceae bacterium]|nr:branched-chain amino acid ABC transporter substrate-binding protein [Anaerolineaceae bacterium]